jgi:hypothetical protein
MGMTGQNLGWKGLLPAESVPWSSCQARELLVHVRNCPV